MNKAKIWLDYVVRNGSSKNLENVIEDADTVIEEFIKRFPDSINESENETTIVQNNEIKFIDKTTEFTELLLKVIQVLLSNNNKKVFIDTKLAIVCGYLFQINNFDKYFIYNVDCNKIESTLEANNLTETIEFQKDKFINEGMLFQLAIYFIKILLSINGGKEKLFKQLLEEDLSTIRLANSFEQLMNQEYKLFIFFANVQTYDNLGTSIQLRKTPLAEIIGYKLPLVSFNKNSELIDGVENQINKNNF